MTPVEPQTLDPALVTGVAEMRLADAIFDGLVEEVPRGLEVVPALARSWEVSGDGREWTFHLREASWSDGGPLGAEDFVWSWGRAAGPGGGDYAYLFRVLAAVEAPDPRTLVVRLRHPCAYFLRLAAFTPFRPVPRRALEAHGETWLRPSNAVSSGPYLLAEWVLNRHILLRANPRWWGAAPGRPASPRVLSLTVESAATGFNLYETGEADLVTEVPAFLMDALRGREDLHLGDTLGTLFARLNVTRPPLDDPRVRRALGLALDREAICRRILRGGERPALSLVPPGIPGYEPPQGPGRDVDEARRLLGEAGYPGGRGLRRLDYVYNTGDANRDLAEVLQAQWREALGVEVALVHMEWKVYLDAMDRLDYDLARSSWIADYVDPSTFLDLFQTGAGNNRTGWSDPDYDALVSLAGRTPEGPARRTALRRAEARLLESAPVLPIHHYSTRNLHGPRVRGVEPNVRNLIALRGLAVE
ncbi:MAG: peptide ABC transporter substrate-binding protein [Planctomycetes bacterium]|nr:peptide ABC transporter substrate-binding protein [Planctomycetota bacterium]